MKSKMKITDKDGNIFEFEAEISKEFLIQNAEELQRLITEAQNSFYTESTGFDKVPDGNLYYFSSARGEIVEGQGGDGVSNSLYEAANYYSVIEIAERENFITNLTRRLRRFASNRAGYYINEDSFECDTLWVITMRMDTKEFNVEEIGSEVPFGMPVFVSEEHAWEAIRIFREELTAYFCGNYTPMSNTEKSE